MYYLLNIHLIYFGINGVSVLSILLQHLTVLRLIHPSDFYYTVRVHNVAGRTMIAQWKELTEMLCRRATSRLGELLGLPGRKRV